MMSGGTNFQRVRSGTQQSSTTDMQRVEDEDYEEEEVDIVDESGNVLDKRDRKRTQITSTQEKLLAKSKQLNRNRQTLDIDNSGLNQNEDGASSYNNSEFPRNQA